MHLLIQHLLGREGISAAVSEPEAQFEPCAIRGKTLWGVLKVTQILRSILCCGEHFPIYSVEVTFNRLNYTRSLYFSLPTQRHSKSFLYNQ